MVCTCGTIRRPLGASRSIGTTSTASSPGGTRSATIAGGRRNSSGAARIRASRSSRMPRPAVATVSIAGDAGAIEPLDDLRRRAGQVGLVEDHHRRRPAGLAVLRARPPRRVPTARHRPPAAPGRCGRRPGGSSRRALGPGRPTSSMPAVSMKSTGPRGSSSMGFSTGSVVVPATVGDDGDLLAGSAAFSSDDLPALRRPKRPMCRRKLFGAGCMNLTPGAFREPVQRSGRRFVRPPQATRAENGQR